MYVCVMYIYLCMGSGCVYVCIYLSRDMILSMIVYSAGRARWKHYLKKIMDSIMGSSEQTLRELRLFFVF